MQTLISRHPALRSSFSSLRLPPGIPAGGKRLILTRVGCLPWVTIEGQRIGSSTIRAGGSLNVPHDWSIEGAFSKDNPATPGGGALPGGIGWYRKTFTLPAGDSGKAVFVDFDGVYRNSEVWINGHALGMRPSGYISFRYEMTPYLHVREAETTPRRARGQFAATQFPVVFRLRHLSKRQAHHNRQTFCRPLGDVRHNACR